MTKLRDQVKAFHEAFGVEMRATPGVPDDETLALRLRLIGEEVVELFEACGFSCTAIEDEIADSIKRGRINGRAHLTEIADALGDIDYVAEGFRLVCGINGEPIADEIQRSNMAKLGQAGKPIRRDDGKLLKPAGWQPPQIYHALIAQGWEPST